MVCLVKQFILIFRQSQLPPCEKLPIQGKRQLLVHSESRILMEVVGLILPFLFCLEGVVFSQPFLLFFLHLAPSFIHPLPIERVDFIPEVLMLENGCGEYRGQQTRSGWNIHPFYACAECDYQCCDKQNRKYKMAVIFHYLPDLVQSGFCLVLSFPSFFGLIWMSYIPFNQIVVKYIVYGLQETTESVVPTD